MKPPRVKTRMAPGGLWFEVRTDEGTVLAADGLTPDQVTDGREQSAMLAGGHWETAARWCDDHPGRDCWVLIFDGDTGQVRAGVAVNTENRPDLPVLPGGVVLATGVPLHINPN